MKAGGRSVRLSVRAERALFAGIRVLPSSKNPFLRARKKARVLGRKGGYRLPNQRRAYQCLNVFGVRIWADKPRQFKGMKWRARCATVARFVARCEFREFRAWQREGLAPFVARRKFVPPIDSLCFTRQNLDATDFLPAGGCLDLSPFWVPGDEPPQIIVARGGL